MSPHARLLIDRTVCHNFLKECEVTLPCPYRSTWFCPWNTHGNYNNHLRRFLWSNFPFLHSSSLLGVQQLLRDQLSLPTHADWSRSMGHPVLQSSNFPFFEGKFSTTFSWISPPPLWFISAGKEKVAHTTIVNTSNNMTCVSTCIAWRHNSHKCWWWLMCVCVYFHPMVTIDQPPFSFPPPCLLTLTPL